jgi:hypothetical protein
MGSLEVRGPLTDKTPAANPLQVNSFWITTFDTAFFPSNLSMLETYVFEALFGPFTGIFF